MPETSQEAYERGKKEGVVSQRLDEHSKHLSLINGSIERTAQGLEKLATMVSAQSVRFDTFLAVQKAAGEALAIETKRQHNELVEKARSSENMFSRRTVVIGLLVSFGIMAAALISLYLELR